MAGPKPMLTEFGILVIVLRRWCHATKLIDNIDISKLKVVTSFTINYSYPAAPIQANTREEGDQNMLGIGC